MRVQVVVATMHQKDFSKYSDMNLKTDAVFANQTIGNEKKSVNIGGKLVEMVSTDTRGVGINRNIGLMNAQADVLLIADDDMKYVDEYEQIVLQAFSEAPDADAIIFNIETIGKNMSRRENNKITRIHFYNALNYGAARIAVKTKGLRRENIWFSTIFGGGTKYSAGEDTIFICDMLKRGLKIYTYPKTIASVDQTSSTWFEGYTEKYFFDKGALYTALSKRFYLFLCIQDVLRHLSIYKDSKFSTTEKIKLMFHGAKSYSEQISYESWSGNKRIKNWN